ncbi:MAG: nucleotidyltransferase family protein [Candidatus Aminicenantes bacterium]|nr:nucleotidyltransferase family protein [Candidatus Aminicenantes bacterium]
MVDEATQTLKKYSSEIKKKFRIKEIGIFGSQIKGKARKRSDIDILVEFEKEGETFDNYMELKFFLEKLLDKKVDLVIKNTIKDKIKENILAEVIYV